MKKHVNFKSDICKLLSIISLLFVFVFFSNAQLIFKSEKTEALTQKSDSVKPDIVYSVIEKMPQYPGGEQALLNFIGNNIKYPIDAQEKGIQGTVIVRFVVTNLGKVESPSVLRSLCPSADKEALRVISSLPNWIPGEQKGQKVSVYYTLPIRYKLTGESKPAEAFKKPLVILDTKVLPADYLANITKDSIESLNFFTPDKKEKLAELALKYNVDTSNGVIVVTTKAYMRQNTTEKGQMPNQNAKLVEDKDINFDTFIDGKTPLFVLDGKEVSKKVASKIDKNDIQKFSILKNNAAIKQYGKKGKNGVIVITLKK